jgi:hypothetical protein
MKASATMITSHSPCRSTDPHRDARGQIIVIFVAGLFAMIAAVALVIEGANLFAQQRVAQNGADGASQAGAVVLADYWSGATRDGDQVAAAVVSAALANGLTIEAAEYTDSFGVPIGAAVDLANATPADPIPATAQGVAVTGNRSFGTAFARVIGISDLAATADATTVVGVLSTECVAEQDGCAMLPVTFPITPYLCDAGGDLDEGSVPWGIGAPADPNNPTGPYWQLASAEDLPSSTNTTGNLSKLAILSLCRSSGGSSGGFGWLDLVQPGMNLAQEIEGPLDLEIFLPDWFQTQTGNPNSVEDELLDHWREPILIPLYDAACRVEPVDPDPATPANEGACPTGQFGIDPNANGNNTWYHIPTITVFYLESVYVQGSNKDQCTTGPGQPTQPVSTGGGFLGCLKGWFVHYLVGGPIIPGELPDRGIDPIGLVMIR